MFRASFAWVVTASAGLIATRSLSSYALNHPKIEQRLTRRLAIIGLDIYAFRVAERLAGEAQKGITVFGVFYDSGPQQRQEEAGGTALRLDQREGALGDGGAADLQGQGDRRD